MNPSSDYPWYKTVNASEPVQQGDIVVDCPVLVPSSEQTDLKPDEVTGEVIQSDVIILTQSCDLAARKIDIVLVCPLYTLDEYAKTNTGFLKDDNKESLRRGYVHYLHLLNQCKQGKFDNFLVVEFKNVYGVTYDFLENYAQGIGERVRLLPPYREHLSQAFARYFMRVGLPLDIEKFN